MLGLIRRERRRSRDQAAAFYRLYRALETGHTVPPLSGEHMGETTTLGELREDWAEQIDAVRTPEPDDGAEIRLDGFDWPEEPEERHDRAAVASLVSQGPAKVRQHLDQAGTDEARGRLDDGGFLQELEDAVDTADRSSAGAADREVLRAGRDLIDRASRQDRRVVGRARITDGNPCAFCAMLASRGAIYTSQSTVAGGGRRWPAETQGLPGRTATGQPSSSRLAGGPDSLPQRVSLPDGPRLLAQRLHDPPGPRLRPPMAGSHPRNDRRGGPEGMASPR